MHCIDFIDYISDVLVIVIDISAVIVVNICCDQSIQYSKGCRHLKRSLIMNGKETEFFALFLCFVLFRKYTIFFAINERNQIV